MNQNLIKLAVGIGELKRIIEQQQAEIEQLNDRFRILQQTVEPANETERNALWGE